MASLLDLVAQRARTNMSEVAEQPGLADVALRKPAQTAEQQELAFGSPTAQSFESGYESTKSMVKNALAASADAIGNASFGKSMRASAAQNDARAAQLAQSAGAPMSLKDTSFDTAGAFLGQGVVRNAPQIGAMVAGRTVLGPAGVPLTATALNVGDVYGQAQTEIDELVRTGQIDATREAQLRDQALKASGLAGVVMGALDTVGYNAMFPGLASTVARSIPGRVLNAMVKEGGTEAVQEYIGLVANKLALEKPEAFGLTADDAWRLADAGALGTAAGGTFGTPGALAAGSGDLVRGAQNLAQSGLQSARSAARPVVQQGVQQVEDTYDQILRPYVSKFLSAAGQEASTANTEELYGQVKQFVKERIPDLDLTTDPTVLGRATGTVIKAADDFLGNRVVPPTRDAIAGVQAGFDQARDAAPATQAGQAGAMVGSAARAAIDLTKQGVQASKEAYQQVADAYRAETLAGATPSRAIYRTAENLVTSLFPKRVPGTKASVIDDDAGRIIADTFRRMGFSDDTSRYFGRQLSGLARDTRRMHEFFAKPEMRQAFASWGSSENVVRQIYLDLRAKGKDSYDEAFTPGNPIYAGLEEEARAGELLQQPEAGAPALAEEAADEQAVQEDAVGPVQDEGELDEYGTGMGEVDTDAEIEIDPKRPGAVLGNPNVDPNVAARMAFNRMLATDKNAPGSKMQVIERRRNTLTGEVTDIPHTVNLMDVAMSQPGARVAEEGVTTTQRNDTNFAEGIGQLFGTTWREGDEEIEILPKRGGTDAPLDAIAELDAQGNAAGGWLSPGRVIGQQRTGDDSRAARDAGQGAGRTVDRTFGDMQADRVKRSREPAGIARSLERLHGKIFAMTMANESQKAIDDAHAKAANWIGAMAVGVLHTLAPDPSRMRVVDKTVATASPDGKTVRHSQSSPLDRFELMFTATERYIRQGLAPEEVDLMWDEVKKMKREQKQSTLYKKIEEAMRLNDPQFVADLLPTDALDPKVLLAVQLLPTDVLASASDKMLRKLEDMREDLIDMPRARSEQDTSVDNPEFNSLPQDEGIITEDLAGNFIDPEKLARTPGRHVPRTRKTRATFERPWERKDERAARLENTAVDARIGPPKPVVQQEVQRGTVEPQVKDTVSPQKRARQQDVSPMLERGEGVGPGPGSVNDPRLPFQNRSTLPGRVLEGEVDNVPPTVTRSVVTARREAARARVREDSDLTNDERAEPDQGGSVDQMIGERNATLAKIRALSDEEIPNNLHLFEEVHGPITKRLKSGIVEFEDGFRMDLKAKPPKPKKVERDDADEPDIPPPDPKGMQPFKVVRSVKPAALKEGAAEGPKGLSGSGKKFSRIQDLASPLAPDGDYTDYHDGHQRRRLTDDEVSAMRANEWAPSEGGRSSSFDDSRDVGFFEKFIGGTRYILLWNGSYFEVDVTGEARTGPETFPILLGPFATAQKAMHVAEMYADLGSTKFSRAGASGPEIDLARATQEIRAIAGRVGVRLGTENSYDPAEHVITLAATPHIGLGTAYHEGLHAVFKAVAPEDKASLYKGLNTINVKRQLRELLAEHPDALKDALADAEELAAYSFQFWRLGMLKLRPDVENVFEKIERWIREAAAWLTGQPGVEELFQRIADGYYRDGGPSPVELAMAKHARPAVQKVANTVANGLLAVYDKLLTAHDDRIRAVGVGELTRLAREFYVQPGEDAPRRGLAQEIPVATGKWLNELGKVIGDDPSVAHAALEAMANGDESSPKARQFRKYLDDIHKYMTAAGVDIGYLENYVPMQWSGDLIAGNETEFVAMLNQYRDQIEALNNELKLTGSKRMTPASITNMMKQRNLKHAIPTGDLFDDAGVPTAHHLEDRVFQFLTNADRAPFTEPNRIGTFGQYVKQAVKHAEWVRRFGNQSERYSELLAGAKARGATKADIALVNDLKESVFGAKYNRMDPTLRRVLGGVQTYQNIRVLGLAVFSSLADPLAIAVRSGDFAEAWDGFKAGIKGIFGRYKPAELQAIAEDIGAASELGTVESLATLYGGFEVEGNFKKANDLMFKLNGLDGLTRALRVFAVGAGLRFIARADERQLRELGLTRDDLLFFEDGTPKVRESDGLTPAQAEKMRSALNRFVDESVLRPNAAERPVWGNNPYFALLFHLKQFVFSFHKIVGRKIAHELENGNPMVALHAAAIVPVMAAAGYMKDAIQFAGAIPADRDFLHYLGVGANRSGLLGPGTLASEFASDLRQGHSGVSAIGGPTASQALEALQAVGDPGRMASWAEEALPLSSVWKRWNGN